MADDIIKCGLSVFSNIKCDKYHLYPKDTGVIPLKNCNIDITAHLKSVKVAAGGFRNFSRSPVADNEGQLILNRVGLFDTKLYKDIFVCPAHRFKLGIYFKQKKTCQFPDHEGKGKVYRGVSLEESEWILHKHSRLLPVGEGKFLSEFLIHSFKCL